MAADRDRVLKRVTEVLNLCDPGTYSATLSSRNKTRNADAIADFVDEAGMKILQAIAERPNEFRYLLAETSPPITSSPTDAPPHLGPLIAVRIVPWDGAPYMIEGARRSYDKVVSYRLNRNGVYGPVNHNSAEASDGSSYTAVLSGGIVPREEIPTGLVNGTNMVFELGYEPTGGVIVFSVNGVVRSSPADYSISGTTVTMTWAPATGSDLWATYMSGDAEAIIVGDDEELVHSELAGYYDLWNDQFHFTGHSAIIRYARVPVRADIADELIPDIFENTWIRLALGEAEKAGVGGYETQLLQRYGLRGQSDLEEFKNGGRVFKEVDDPRPVEAVHTVK